jgi:hypothetical protein
MKNWKTTAVGILGFLIATLTILDGFLGVSDVKTGGAKATVLGSVHLHTWIPVGVTITLALCRAWVGLLQQDAGVTPAVMPGGAIAQVASHEVPNDPSATPVSQAVQKTGVALLLLMLGGTLALSTGCHVNAALPPPPPGAVNATDALANEILQPIAAFASALSKQVQAGTITLTGTQREALDALNAAVNTADAAEIAYHNSGGSTSATALTAALTAVQQSFATLEGQLPMTVPPGMPVRWVRAMM